MTFRTWLYWVFATFILITAHTEVTRLLNGDTISERLVKTVQVAP